MIKSGNPARPPSAWPRRLLAAVCALGLLGAAAQSQALVLRERAQLEARVELLRQTLGPISPPDQARPDPDEAIAQWYNWPNWSNWNNWNNWLNWNNWGNWFNR